MIFLIGATGNVGSSLMAQLTQRGTPARALAHSPASREQIEATGIEAVAGDLDAPDALEQAMAGCDHLFLLSPPHPDQPTREKGAIDAAKRAGVSHVVAVSFIGSDPESPVVLGQWHGEIDRYLLDSGVGYTILRPTAFMQSHLLPVETVNAQGSWYGIAGDGGSAFIDVEDVAAVAVEALTRPGHDRATYDLTGPSAISMPEAAAVLAEVIGRRVDYVDVPPDQFRASLGGAGLPDWLVDALLALYQAIREGHSATVTNTVQEVTGRPARTYRDFAEAHKDLFASG